MTERLKTLIFTALSGLFGFLGQQQFDLFIVPFFLFGIGVLLANHSHIRLRKKLLAYLIILPVSMIIFLFGGIFFSAIGHLLTGYLSDFIAVYIGSGLCALAMAFSFQLLLTNVKISLIVSLLIFALGAISLVIFFLITGERLDNLYRDISVDKNMHVLTGIWQTLVGVGIALSVKRG